MDKLVYLLCALTSIACMALLFRRHRQARVPLLFWSSAAFLAFAIANVLLFVDLVIIPNHDLLIWRQGITFAGVLLLLYGLIKTNN